MKKIKDIVIYEDAQYYASFPSVVCRPDGELIVAFRRAPERRPYGGEPMHSDPNSYLVLVRSRDNGDTWTAEPELIHAHPMGGSQDPCMVQLSDGTILCTSYLWLIMPADTDATLRKNGWRFSFGGGYIMRSTDGGHRWEGPIVPPAVPGSESSDYLGRPVPACARGAMVEGREGLLYWAVTRHTRTEPEDSRTSVQLLVSEDKGFTWKDRCPVATDDSVTFNETSLYETDAGDLVAFMRTANFDGHTVVARSRDRGRSFEPWEDTGFRGHPHHACRLPDGRTLLVRGYRHEPYGIRAHALNAECTDFREAEDFVLREDGGSGDIGYPWLAVLPGGHVLAVYYFNIDGGTRHIAGTLLDPTG